MDIDKTSRILLIDVDRTLITHPVPVSLSLNNGASDIKPIYFTETNAFYLRSDTIEFLTFFLKKGYRIALASHNSTRVVPNLAKFLRREMGCSDDELKWFVWPPNDYGFRQLKDISNLFETVRGQIIVPRFTIIDDQLGAWSHFSIKYSDSFHIPPFEFMSPDPSCEQFNLHSFRSVIARSTASQWRQNSGDLVTVLLLIDMISLGTEILDIIVQYVSEFEFYDLCREYLSYRRNKIVYGSVQLKLTSNNELCGITSNNNSLTLPL